MGRKPKGSYLHSDGYVILSGGRHGQYEHRVVAENILGRKLIKGELIHHINGIKQDNRPENLLITNYKTHNITHLSKPIKTKCGYCNKPMLVVPSRLVLSKTGKVFCCSNCSGKAHNGGGIKGKPFTQDEVELIIKLSERGNFNYNRIAYLLNRTRGSIRVKIRELKEVNIICAQ